MIHPASLTRTRHFTIVTRLCCADLSVRLRVLQGGPGLAVTHPLRHPWVDAAGRLSFPSLLHWVPSQSSLVAVVAEALSELTGLQHAGPQSPQPSSSGEIIGICSDLSTTWHIHEAAVRVICVGAILFPGPSAQLAVMLRSAVHLESPTCQLPSAQGRCACHH